MGLLRALDVFRQRPLASQFHYKTGYSFWSEFGRTIDWLDEEHVNEGLNRNLGASWPLRGRWRPSGHPDVSGREPLSFATSRDFSNCAKRVHVALRSSRTPTTVPSRISRTIGSLLSGR